MKQVCKTKKIRTMRDSLLPLFHVSNRFEIISDCCFVVAISIFYYFFISIEFESLNLLKFTFTELFIDKTKMYIMYIQNPRMPRSFIKVPFNS